MNEKYKNWLKKVGIAGFLFFLLKGIFWLIFGTAFYKWLKELLIITASTCVPVAMDAQTPLFKLNEIKLPYTSSFQIHKPNLWINEYKVKPFFCRLEDQLNTNKKTHVKFRLGSLQYSNELEYPKFPDNKEQGNIYLR